MLKICIFPVTTVSIIKQISRGDNCCHETATELTQPNAKSTERILVSFITN